MPPTLPPETVQLTHISLLRNTAELKTSDGVKARVLELLKCTDEKILSAWAKHFREHYCKDDDIDADRASTGLSRKEYLKQLKIPDSVKLGLATRVSDFSEILIADYLMFALNYFVPRVRYDDKKNKNNSPQGIDVVGFKILDPANVSRKDELITFEVKSSMGLRPNHNTLEKAIEGSKKDYEIKTPEALNAIRQRLKDRGQTEEMKIVERFQNITDRPYKKISGAAAVHSTNTWDDSIVTNVSADHPNKNILLLGLKGDDLLELVNQLYERVCDEA